MKKQQTLDFEGQLHTVPVRNEHVRIMRSEEKPDVIVAEIKLRYYGLLKILKQLTNARPYRRFELAGLTRELYEKLDGTRTVEDLVDDLAASEKLTFFESRAFVVQYLKNLMERGLIVIVPEDEVKKTSR